MKKAINCNVLPSEGFSAKRLSGFLALVLLLLMTFSQAHAVNLYKNDLLQYETLKKDSIPNNDTNRVNGIYWLTGLKNKVLNELTNETIDSNRPVVIRAEEILSEYVKYQGKIIRKINFSHYDPFGKNVTETGPSKSNRIESFINRLHIKTQPFVLKNSLIISENDRLDLYTLTENERIYRELPFIDDARVIVTEVDHDSVDITFITKDVLPVGGSIEFLDVDYGRASVSNKNILGLGHELYYHLTWNYDRTPFYGHKIRYRVVDLGRTFFSLDVSYENQWNYEALKFTFKRDFFTQETRYAGGINFEKVNSIVNIVLPDTIIENINSDYNYYDLWIGRAISLPSVSSFKKRANIVGAGRIIRYEFFERPDFVQEDFLYKFQEKTAYLFTLGLSQVGYYKTQEVYGFGHTEDIPFGNNISLTAGTEVNEFFNRPYFGFTYSWGYYFEPIGYLYSRIDFGTFFNYGIKQGLLIWKFKHISNQFNSDGRFRYRLFTNVLYKSGYNRMDDEFMEFTKKDGIRGLSSRELVGNQRMNVSLEGVCYSPHVLLGFNFQYYLFFDVGIISNKHSILFDNPLYTGFGGGIRIRNENLVFDTIILRAGYYPVLPVNASVEYLKLTSAGNPDLDKFVVQRPEIIQY